MGAPESDGGAMIRESTIDDFERLAEEHDKPAWPRRPSAGCGDATLGETTLLEMLDRVMQRVDKLEDENRSLRSRVAALAQGYEPCE
jgi:hypothetical protein